jgi:hypothetical protein
MVVPSDKAYIETKQIMLGKAKMNSDFVELANFIDKTFNVKTINIIYDIINKGKQPRLNICFEFEHEEQIFRDKYRSFYTEKQKVIVEKFNDILKEKKITEKKLFFVKSKYNKYKTNKLLVIFSAFEPIAKISAIDNIPQDKIDQLKNDIGNSDLWEISKCFSRVTFFFYTDQQVKQYEGSDTIKQWFSKFFDILEEYNEFKYFNREEFKIYLDSKENFDNNYQSSWFWYYR